MLSSITTKIALKKIGLSSDTFNFTSPEPSTPRRKTNRNAPPGTIAGLDDEDDGSSKWNSWMTVKSLPLGVQTWLTPPPPPIPVAAPPSIGDMAPVDRDRKLAIGNGRKVLIVFLRCVGCAFAQKTFLALRTLANKYPGTLTCIAVSHSSAAATQKWIDLMGGAWSVQVVVDEDRAVYAAWGLGVGSVWHVLNYTTQVQSWKEKGWLGSTVAGSIQRSGALDGPPQRQGLPYSPRRTSLPLGNGAGVVGADLPSDGPTTAMGNKWQETGAWAVDGRGKIVWGGKAARADDVPNLYDGINALQL